MRARRSNICLSRSVLCLRVLGTVEIRRHYNTHIILILKRPDVIGDLASSKRNESATRGIDDDRVFIHLIQDLS